MMAVAVTEMVAEMAAVMMAEVATAMMMVVAEAATPAMVPVAAILNRGETSGRPGDFGGHDSGRGLGTLGSPEQGHADKREDDGEGSDQTGSG
ncbi:hypothetical protein [Methylobacterium goesingense]|uniref:Secreted protein n=1 Tax=Methylobacterium goesingense TaxID=243690 RepID=A0ABV2L0Y6_9HYPH|nr:hypothetical protein [Methylobacterium goesingense]